MPSLPRRIILEKEGHTGRATIPLSNQYPELGIRRETIPDQVVFCRSNCIGFPLILRQLANESQDQRDVLDTCLANFQHGLSFHSLLVPKSCDQLLLRKETLPVTSIQLGELKNQLRSNDYVGDRPYQHSSCGKQCSESSDPQRLGPLFRRISSSLQYSRYCYFYLLYLMGHRPPLRR